MSEIPLCTLAISSRLPEDDIDALETSLRMNEIQVRKPPSRIFDADDIVLFLAILGAINTVATTIENANKAAKVINNWRQKLRENGREPEGRLEQADRPDLDLNTSSDEEVEEWFKP